MLKLLQPMIKSYKGERGQNGRYKKAYVEIEGAEPAAEDSREL